MPLLQRQGPPPPLPPDPRLAPDQIIRMLAPHLSAERRARIERVLHHRLLSVTVVLENLYDPHNGAAVLRSCEAMGLLHLHVVQSDKPFFFAPKVSQKAHKWLNVHLYPNVDECLGTLRAWGFSCWAALPPSLGDEPPRPGPPVDERGPVALVFGNEHLGLSRRAKELCDRQFSIPLFGFSESLNLSVTAAMTLGRIVEARRARLGGRGELDGEALGRLRAAYYALSTHHAAEIVHHHLRRAGVARGDRAY
jgi:tRNA (guanosine-2'-O-)-methyltransferase